MTTSTVIYGLSLTFVLFMCASFYKRYKTIYQNHKVFRINAFQIHKQLEETKAELSEKLTESIQARLALEEELDRLKQIVSNQRKVERKHKATIKKLAGK